MPKKKNKSLKKKKVVPVKKASIKKKTQLKKKKTKKKIEDKKKPKALKKTKKAMNGEMPFMTRADIADIAMMIGGLSLITILMIAIS